MKGLTIFFLSLAVFTCLVSSELPSWYIAVSSMPEFENWCSNSTCNDVSSMPEFEKWCSNSTCMLSEFPKHDAPFDGESRWQTCMELAKTMHKEIVFRYPIFRILNTTAVLSVMNEDWFCNAKNYSERQQDDIFNDTITVNITFTINLEPSQPSTDIISSTENYTGFTIFCLLLALAFLIFLGISDSVGSSTSSDKEAKCVKAKSKRLPNANPSETV